MPYPTRRSPSGSEYTPLTRHQGAKAPSTRYQQQKLANDLRVALLDFESAARRLHGDEYERFTKLARRYLDAHPDVNVETWHEINRSMYALLKALAVAGGEPSGAAYEGPRRPLVLEGTLDGFRPRATRRRSKK